MRLRLLMVLAASLILIPAAFADSVPPTVAVDTNQVLPAEDGDCTASLAPEADLTFGALGFENVGTQFDGKQGAENRYDCWTETKTTWSCDCYAMGQTRARRHNLERDCCGNGWCSGYTETSNSCTGNIC